MSMPRHKSALRYPLSGILSSELRVDVLRELFTHGGMLSAPQLVMRTGFAQSSVREALISLVETQVIEVLGAGKTVLYRANRLHPLSKTLDRLFEHEESRYVAIGEGIRAVAAHAFGNQIEAVWLFGSVARGDDNFSSDLDLAVIVRDREDDELADRIADSLEPVQDRLMFRASVVTLTLDDVARLQEEKAPLMQNFQNDAIAIVGSRPADLLGRMKAKQLVGHGT